MLISAQQFPTDGLLFTPAYPETCKAHLLLVSADPARPVDRMLPSKGNSGRRLILTEAVPMAKVTSTAGSKTPMMRGRLLPSKGNSGRRMLA
jgi:hypothetical protein